MEENGRAGVTFGEIGRAIRKRLLVVLGTTVLFTVLLVLAVAYLYNPNATGYSLTFGFTFPGNDLSKYPDGTPFYYQDIVSAAALGKVKATDERFSAIDIERMTESDDVVIERVTRELGGEQGFSENYKITIKSSYFSSRTTAKLFLRAAASQPLVEAAQKAGEVNYFLDSEIFTSADFSGRLLLLSRQKESLLDRYREWIELYSGGYSVAGKTLSNYLAEVEVVYGDSTRESLETELETNGYLSSDETVIRAQIEALNAEKALNETKIAKLKEELGSVPAMFASETKSETSAATPVLSVSEMLASLISRNAEIDNQISMLQTDNVKRFEARIDSEYERLKTAATTLQTVGKELYEQEARIDYDTSNITAEGGLSLPLVGVGGAVLFFLVIALVVCAIEIPKARRAEGSEEPPAAEPPADTASDGETPEQEEKEA